MEKITEKTVIPISVSLLIVLIGFVAWLNSIHATTLENTKQIIEIKESRDVIIYKLDKLSDDVAFIRGKLEKR